MVVGTVKESGLDLPKNKTKQKGLSFSEERRVMTGPDPLVYQGKLPEGG